MHLGFAVDAQSLAYDLQRRGIVSLSCTVTPDEYNKLCELGLDDIPHIALGLGLHPWYVDESEYLPAFIGQIGDCRIIGEIGLDFSSKHANSKDMQIRVLNRILDACARGKDKLISIHAVQTKGELVEALVNSGTAQTCTCVLHSFAGSSDELKRAIDAGCYFSVGFRMLLSKRGREYVRVIPESRLLLETDLPERAQTLLAAKDYLDSLDKTLAGIAEIRACDADELACSILETSERIIAQYSF